MYNLFIVHHPLGATFIGVARTIEECYKHFGTRATITPCTAEMVIEMRADGPEKVILAI
jgi:hypothetical protein